MKVAIAVVLAVVLIGAGGYFYYHQTNTDHASGPHSIAVLPFRTTGAAETGPYALLIGEFADMVSIQLNKSPDWTVLENSRKDLLLQELDAEFSPSINQTRETNFQQTLTESSISTSFSDLSETTISQIKATYPAADYVMLGKVLGFDVNPVREGGIKTLSERRNRIRTRIEVAVVNLQTRGYLISQVVPVDAIVSDQSQADTQINAALQQAALQVTNSLLLANAQSFDILDFQEANQQAEGQQQLISFNGGSLQGVSKGLVFNTNTGDSARQGAQLEVIEVRPTSALAKLISGNVTAKDTVIAQPVLSEVVETASVVRIAVDSFYADKLAQEFVLADLIRNQSANHLKLNLQRYGGVSVLEQHKGIVKRLLGEQLMDDLSKGRETGFPRGSIQGADYIAFAVINAIAYTTGESTETVMFGTSIKKTKPSEAIIDANIYLIDVFSGEYALSQSVVSTTFIDREMETDQIANRVSQQLAQDMFAALMFEVRPLTIIAHSDGNAVINHKAMIGLEVGDQLQASGAGEAVVDQYTGAQLDGVGGKIIGTLEITHFDGAGWAHAKVVDGQLPETGARLAALNTGAQNTETQNAIDEKRPSERSLTW